MSIIKNRFVSFALIPSVFIIIALIFTYCSCKYRSDKYYFYNGMKWFRHYKFDIAISNFNEAIKKNPKYLNAYIYRGRAWYYKKDYNKAVSDFNRAKKINPNDTRSCYFRALTYIQKRNYIESIKDLERVLKNIPNPDESFLTKEYQWEEKAYHTKGRAYAKMGSINKAYNAYNKALNAGETSNALIIIDRSLVLKLKKKEDEALESFKEAESILKNDLIDKPGNPFLLNIRGYVELVKGDFDKAIEDFTKVIDYRKNTLEEYKKESYTYRGLAYQATKKYYYALNDFNRSIELDPQYLEAYLSLSWLLATCPNIQYRNGGKALKVANKALGIVQSSTSTLEIAYVYVVLSAAYAELGKFKEAIEKITTAKKNLEEIENNELKIKLINETNKLNVSYKTDKAWVGEWYGITNMQIGK